MNVVKTFTSWWQDAATDPRDRKGRAEFERLVAIAYERMNGVESSDQRFNKQPTRSERGLRKET